MKITNKWLTSRNNLIYKANKLVNITEQFNLQNEQFNFIGERSQRKIQRRKLKTKGEKEERKKYVKKRK